jgi:pectinesterase
MRAFITVEGAGADRTVVQWGDTAETVGSLGRPMGTFGSATFAVNSMFFVAKNITFKVSLVPRRACLAILWKRMARTYARRGPGLT